MGTYTADQFVGKTLIAVKDLTAYYGHPGNADKFIVKKGQNIGTVYSWITKNTPDGKLWWEFVSKENRFYFVPGDINVGMTNYDKLTIPTIDQKVKTEKEKAEKETDGAFVYYLKTWGKKILIGAAITYVVVEGVKIVANGSNRTTKS